MKIAYPYRCKLRKMLPKFRVEEHTHAKLSKIATKYDIQMSELCRMAVDQLVAQPWPKVHE